MMSQVCAINKWTRTPETHTDVKTSFPYQHTAAGSASSSESPHLFYYFFLNRDLCCLKHRMS